MRFSLTDMLLYLPVLSSIKLQNTRTIQ